MRRYVTVVLLALLGTCANFSAVADTAAEQLIRSKIKSAKPKIVISSIRESRIPGVYEVQAEGYEPVYVSADGRYMLQGELLEIRGNRIVNISEEGRTAVARKLLAETPVADMVVFSPKGKPKAIVYAFTDVDCGYCRKLHAEVPKMNQLGIEVRYLAYPRSGPKGGTAAKMDAVWCAQDRNAAMTKAKQGVALPQAAAACRSPVGSEYELGNRIGVDGTPAIYTVDGSKIGGYLSADDLAEQLNIR